MTQRVLVTGRGFRHRKRNSADIRGKRRHSLRLRCGTETATLPFCLAMQFLQRRVGAERSRLLRLLPAGLAGWPVTYWECAALSPRRLARRIVSVTAPGETMTSVHGAAPSAMGRQRPSGRFSIIRGPRHREPVVIGQRFCDYLAALQASRRQGGFLWGRGARIPRSG